jgi:hypothetical protein
MPTAAVERSPIDFTIAVFQALLYGVSMLAPQLHFLSIASILLVAMLRQDREFNDLSSHFTNQILKRQPLIAVGPATVSDSSQAQKKIKNEVKNIIIKSEMTGWRPVSKTTSRGIIWLIFGGFLALLFPTALSFTQLSISTTLIFALYLCASLILFSLVLRGSLETMREGSRFINDKDALERLDQKYRALEEKLLALTPK